MLEKLVQKINDKKGGNRGHDDDDEEDDLIIKQDSDENEDLYEGIDAQTVELLSSLIIKIKDTLTTSVDNFIPAVFDQEAKASLGIERLGAIQLLH